MSGRMRTGTWIIILSIAAWGSWRAVPARAGDEIDRVLSEAGKLRYEQYCTECHGPGGAPGNEAKVDLRTYVARHGGKFPAADWLAIIADARPASPHARVWERIRKDQPGTSGNAAARAVVGEIARYVNSIQSK